jgi:hypothetical protein
MTNKAKKLLYGLMAEFADPEELLAAARRTYDEGYRQIDALLRFQSKGWRRRLASIGRGFRSSC